VSFFIYLFIFRLSSWCEGVCACVCVLVDGKKAVAVALAQLVKIAMLINPVFHCSVGTQR
jgi:hypothetical protein